MPRAAARWDRLARVTGVAADGGERRRQGAAIPWLLLAALFIVACAGYTALAHESPIPLLIPDEITYGTLARALAGGDGFNVLGVHYDLNSPLYVYLIAPA